MLAIAPRIGGKYHLAKWIIDQFPAHHTYVEAFGGMANVLLQKPRSPEEIIIERDYPTANLLQQIQLDHRGIVDTVSSWHLEDYYELWDDYHNNGKNLSPVEMAALYWVEQHFNRGTKNRNVKAFAGVAVTTIRRKLKLLHRFEERLKDVAIFQHDSLEIIEDGLIDFGRTLVYCDPPYLHSTRKDKGIYRHEMTWFDHLRLLDYARRHRGHFAISGYPSDLYQTMVGHWRCEQKLWQVKGIYGAGRGVREVTECLWCNW